MGKADDQRDAAVDLTRHLIDEGKLLDTGFAVLAQQLISKGASSEQLAAMRLAFMAGAEYMWSSILCMLDPSDEEHTSEDLRRMDQIQKEIEPWRRILSECFDPSKGSA